MITSARHPLVPVVRALEGAGARPAPACVAEGPHLVAEAVAAGLPVFALVHTPAFAASPSGAACVRAAAEHLSPPPPSLRPLPLPRPGAPTLVAPHVLAAMSGVRTPQGVLAVVGLPAEAPAPGACLALALDGVQDPSNVGVLARALCAFGGAGAPLLLGPGSTDPFAGKALRASAGALFRLAVRRVPDLVEALRASAAAGWRWWALEPRCGKPLPEAALTPPCGFAVGSEGGGLSSAVRACCRPLTIPTGGGVESLGAAQAGTIALYAAACAADATAARTP